MRTTKPRQCLPVACLLLLVSGLNADIIWPRPAGIKAQKMIPIVFDGKLAGWAFIGISHISRDGSEKRIPSLRGGHLSVLLDKLGYSPSQAEKLLSWLRKFSDRDKIGFFLLFPASFDDGDHSTGSEIKTATITCRVDRIEVA